MLRAALNSWKTTTVAFLLAANAIGSALVAVLDSDAATNPDWNLVVSLVAAAVGMLLARDADKSSQDAGIR
jgi:hypothetical protein